MELHFFVYPAIILLPPLIFAIIHSKRSGSERLPPGPLGWPVFGHMFNLGGTPHRAIAELEQKYGPVVWLKLGSINTMALLKAKPASEFFKNHDLSFADRTIVETMTAHGYNYGSLALAPYGSRWRVLRRICTVEMFVSKRISETEGIRRKCVDDMLSWIEKDGNGNAIPVGRYAFLASFNMLGNLMMSRDLVDPESEKGLEFYDAMKKVMEWSARPNVSDLFPWIRWIDLQGLKRRANRDMGTAMGIVSGFVKERIQQRKNGEGKEKDFLDVLLESESCKVESEKLTETEIIIFILEIFLAGTETTSTSIEWAMSELLRNPETMAKLKDEISSVVGLGERFLESHIDNLPYLQAVIKETLRLHPPLPFLLPRRAIQDTNFMGYCVPKNTQVFVNVWAIGRDQEYWEDAVCFKPERFLGTNVDYKGQSFELIPFGAGRRMCAGLALGHRMIHFVLGSLVHEFEWELESSVTPDAVDMSERMGITVGKLKPLKAVPRKHARECDIK
ncbi:UNVERIFIED_CONTAM: cytochrome [Sesamum indicum]